LAQAGILFKNAYCSAPLRGPSRASIDFSLTMTSYPASVHTALSPPLIFF